MLRYCCALIITLACQLAMGQGGDSLRYYRFKGLDFTFGGSSTNIGSKTNNNLLKAIVTEEYKGRYDYDNAVSADEDAFIHPIKIAAGVIFGKYHRNIRSFINKNELMFRFSFETRQDQTNYGNLRFKVNTTYIDTAQFNSTYQTQTIGLGYQLATKPFLKNFALFGGANIDFGMATFKRISEIRFRHTGTVYDINNYNVTLSRINTMFGLKYNVSCDLNFFAQLEAGALHYGKDIGTNATYIGGSFGIRYKFLEDQDKLKYSNDGFW